MNGILTYTYGESHFLQLVVMLNSLRKYYNGEIEVYLINENPSEEKLNIFSEYKTKIKPINLEWNKNTYSCVKALMVESSNFDKSILMDTDIIFTGNIDELFEFEKPFMGVKSGRFITKTPTIMGQVNLLSPYSHFKSHFHTLTSEKHYINLGVLGVKKNTPEFQIYKNLIELSKNLCQYNDEIVFNIIYTDNNTDLLDHKFNVLPNAEDFTNSEIDQEDNRIIHYAGGSYTNRHSEKNILIWKNEVQEVIDKHHSYKFDTLRY